MTLKELQQKAERHGKQLVFLKDTDKVQEFDYLQWLSDAYTTLDSGSCLIGMTQGEISNSNKSFQRNYKVARITP